MADHQTVSAGVVLGSASPRRRLLLSAIVPDADIQVLAASIDEDQVASGLEPVVAVQAVARAKADAVAALVAEGALGHPLLVAADTMVVGVDGAVGKPTDRHDAQQMVLRMSGTAITILTGLVVGTWSATLDGYSFTEETVASVVTLKDFDTATVLAYVETGAADDKAGGLELQGRAAPLIDRHHGCFTNTMGLPLCRVARHLDRHRAGTTPNPPPCWSFAPQDLHAQLNLGSEQSKADRCDSGRPG